MRTSIRTFVGAALALLALSGCKKDFLDQDPTQLFTADQLKKASQWNESINEGYINGVLNTFFKDGQATPSRHDDFSQKAFDISSDLMSGDMELQGGQGYGWFIEAARLLSYQRDAAINYPVWRISYRTISMANSFFRSSTGDTTPPEVSKDPNQQIQKKRMKDIFDWGQVKTLRALAYLNLAHFYSKPYASDTKSQLAVPIYAANDDASKPQKLATTEEVYKQIVKDLKEGIAAMDLSKLQRADHQYIDQTVAKGALARAYMDTGNWDEAYTVANSLITEQGEEYPLIPAGELTTNGFNNYKPPEFIWAIDITQDITGSLRSFWGHMNVYTYSYAAVGARKGINKHLQDQIPEYDLRKNWFHPKNGIPWNKFFSATGKPAGMMSDRTWLSDIVFMRMAEMYLIASEAAARKGDNDSAKNILLKLLKERTDSSKFAEVEAEIKGLSPEALLDKIFYNWRVEMWGEGLSLSVIKRFKYDNKRSARNLYFKEEAIKWNDPRLTYEIPQNETINNTLIK